MRCVEWILGGVHAGSFREQTALHHFEIKTARLHTLLLVENMGLQMLDGTDHGHVLALHLRVRCQAGMGQRLRPARNGDCLHVIITDWS